jgi:hypothetical protein
MLEVKLTGYFKLLYFLICTLHVHGHLHQVYVAVAEKI